MKLDMNKVKERIEYIVKEDRKKAETALHNLQVAVYTLCSSQNCWMLADMAARQPGDFYIDDRVAIRNKRQIYEKIAILQIFAKALGKNPHNLKWQHTPYLQ